MKSWTGIITLHSGEEDEVRIRHISGNAFESWSTATDWDTLLHEHEETPHAT